MASPSAPLRSSGITESIGEYNRARTEGKKMFENLKKQENLKNE